MNHKDLEVAAAYSILCCPQCSMLESLPFQMLGSGLSTPTLISGSYPIVCMLWSVVLLLAMPGPSEWPPGSHNYLRLARVQVVSRVRCLGRRSPRAFVQFLRVLRWILPWSSLDSRMHLGLCGEYKPEQVHPWVQLRLVAGAAGKA